MSYAEVVAIAGGPGRQTVSGYGGTMYEWNDGAVLGGGTVPSPARLSKGR